MKLIRYRDAQMKDYTYFWVDKNNVAMSPYFDGENDAKQWAVQYFQKNLS